MPAVLVTEGNPVPAVLVTEGNPVPAVLVTEGNPVPAVLVTEGELVNDMKIAAARTLPLPGSARPWEAGNQGVDEWESARESHETPTLLFFARMEERQKKELSEHLTRKFREYFP